MCYIEGLTAHELVSVNAWIMIHSNCRLCARALCLGGLQGEDGGNSRVEGGQKGATRFGAASDEGGGWPPGCRVACTAMASIRFPVWLHDVPSDFLGVLLPSVFSYSSAGVSSVHFAFLL